MPDEIDDDEEALRADIEEERALFVEIEALEEEARHIQADRERRRRLFERETTEKEG